MGAIGSLEVLWSLLVVIVFAGAMALTAIARGELKVVTPPQPPAIQRDWPQPRCFPPGTLGLERFPMCPDAFIDKGADV